MGPPKGQGKRAWLHGCRYRHWCSFCIDHVYDLEYFPIACAQSSKREDRLMSRTGSKYETPILCGIVTFVESSRLCAATPKQAGFVDVQLPWLSASLSEKWV